MADYIISSLSAVFSPRCRVVSHVSTIPEFIYYPVTEPPDTGDVVTITDDYTATAANYTILVDCSVESKNIVVTLPDVYQVDGLELNITKLDADSYTVTVDGWHGQKINRRTNWKLREQDETLSIQADADGGQWNIL